MQPSFNITHSNKTGALQQRAENSGMAITDNRPQTVTQRRQVSGMHSAKVFQLLTASEIITLDVAVKAGAQKAFGADYNAVVLAAPDVGTLSTWIGEINLANAAITDANNKVQFPAMGANPVTLQQAYDAAVLAKTARIAQYLAGAAPAQNAHAAAGAGAGAVPAPSAAAAAAADPSKKSWKSPLISKAPAKAASAPAAPPPVAAPAKTVWGTPAAKKAPSAAAPASAAAAAVAAPALTLPALSAIVEGYTNHGGFVSLTGKGSLPKGQLVAYVKAQRGQFRLRSDNGEYALYLGDAKDDGAGASWYITVSYNTVNGTGTITHFGPFGPSTAGAIDSAML